MKRFSILFFVVSLFQTGCSDPPVELKGNRTWLKWAKGPSGIRLESLAVKDRNGWRNVSSTSGEHFVVYSPVKPDSSSAVLRTNTGLVFPESIFHYQQDIIKELTRPVSLNTAGETFAFLPAAAKADSSSVSFFWENDVFSMSSRWAEDATLGDVVVEQVVIAKKDGFFSVSTPSLVTIDESNLSWATVPGYFQGSGLQKDSVLACAYGQGIPAFPVVYPERCASTLASVADTKDSVSVAVIAEPGLGRDPWETDKFTHLPWKVGISHMNRKSAISPTLYVPVLGQPDSYKSAGDTIRFSFRFSVLKGNWFDNLQHAAMDVYRLGETLSLRRNKQSLSSRVEAMHRYLTDPKTSLWNLESYKGLKIGAQSYLGGVVGSNGDAMKNADYGAMWMLGRMTGDPAINKGILPFARNFKLVQQQSEDGFFKGAAIGQYYLRKSRQFVEEWGEFVEPVSLTYYTMLDVGNILLFNPEDKDLQGRLRMGAELLLQWQKGDGSWEVAYDRKTEKPIFTDLKDLRPTFYGLLVAYRVLGDKRYLDGARKGAEWYMREGVRKGSFIGVCGDARYAPDFATAQTSQAYLDLYEITKERQWLDAAVLAGKIYTASVYTHPVPRTTKKSVKGIEREDWEISQAGLSFEHGGIMGSAQRHGPIQLASHAGLFVRIFGITGDSIFIDMARAAAIGRHAFVDEKTSVASYYWNAMNKGAGPYPHHAWWQIGWITDYLLSEASLRSQGKITFPRGFVTPKVGPHQSYGFAPGLVFGTSAELVLRQGLVASENPNVETVTAISTDKTKLFVIAMNDLSSAQNFSISISPERLGNFRSGGLKEVTEGISLGDTGSLKGEIGPYGVKVFEMLLK